MKLPEDGVFPVILFIKNEGSEMVLGDLDSYMQKNETRPPTYTIHKNNLKMEKRLSYKSRHH